MASFLRTRGRGDVSRVPLEVGQGKRPHVPGGNVPASFLHT